MMAGMSNETKRYFHRTNIHAARAILLNGFRDASGNFLTSRTHAGVWVSSTPLDENEGAEGNVLLAIDIDPSFVEQHEWKEEKKGYREFLVQAADLNKNGKVQLVDEDEDGLRDVPAARSRAYLVAVTLLEAAEELNSEHEFATFGDRVADVFQDLLDAVMEPPAG